MSVSLSIACTGQMREPEAYLRFLTSLGKNPNVGEIVVPLPIEAITEETFSDQFFELAESPNAKIQPFVPEERVTNPQVINQAIAKAGSDVVLILEKPVSIQRLDFEEINKILRDNPREIVGFTHRIMNEENDPLGQDSYFKSIPDSDSTRYIAYAIRRRYFLELRGFDEDPALQGVLGQDLLKRHERRGGSVVKLGRETGVVYSSPVNPEFTNELPLKNEQVRTIISTKQSIYRNLIEWSVPSELRIPLISVAIATKDRENLVGESIASVLYQGFQDFEIVVIDDGSENPDAVFEAVHASSDPRIKFLRNDESRGVSYARNRAADATDCLLTAVHDDDDIMLPGRLEWGISALNENVDASYGSWTNFDHYDGKLRTFITRENFDSSLVAFSGEGPGHSTWTIPTEVIKTLRYNESLTSSVDHYLATRSAAAGVRWGHIGKVAYLRRVHEFQLTSQDTARQKSGHTLSKFGNTFMASDSGVAEMRAAGKKHKYPAVAGAKSPAEVFSGYLPDHLVRRDVIVDGHVSHTLSVIGMPTKMVSLMEDRDLETGVCYSEQGLLKDVTFDELVKLRLSGVTRWRALGSLRPSPLEGSVDISDEIEHSDVEAELATAREKVLDQGAARMQSILGLLRREFKNGHLLIIDHGKDVPELQVPMALKPAKLQRRLLVRGELGVQLSYTVYGYESLDSTIEAIESLRYGSSLQDYSIFPGSKAEELLDTLSKARELKILSNSISDSGLGR